MSQITIEEIQSICATLNQSTSLSLSSMKVLNLRECKLENEAIDLLASALYNNRSLMYLDLSRNYCGATGCDSLMKSLKQNRCLLTLDLSQNFIGSGATKLIREMLKVNDRLVTLNLDGNAFERSDIDALSSAVESHNGTIKSFGFKLWFGWDTAELQRNNNVTNRNLNLEKVLWPILVDICVAFAPLQLPAYVFLHIIDGIDTFHLLAHRRKIALITKIWSSPRSN